MNYFLANKIIYKGLDNISTEVLDYDREMFCINGKLIPSFFVIGTQKCGTTTLDRILLKFKEVSHGVEKEHHFFDNENTNLEKYINTFPNCDVSNNRMKLKEIYLHLNHTSKILRSYNKLC